MERNKENLRRAIGQLPEYQPPYGVWHDLAEQLDFELKLEAPLKEMPVYTPPATIWSGLAERIEQTPELKPRSRVRAIVRWLIGALLLAFFIGWRLVQTEVAPPSVPEVAPKMPKPVEAIAQTHPSPQPTAPPTHHTPRPTTPSRIQSSITYRTELVDDALIMASRRVEDPGYEVLETLCRDALPVCEGPQFKQLKAELEELTLAYSELKTALGNFADDPEMVVQLIEIERTRYQILQQLIAMM